MIQTFPSLAVALGLVALLAILSGCVEDAGPRARTPGAEFPLGLRSESSADRSVLVRVMESAGGSALIEQTYRLAPGSSGKIDPMRVPFGTYLLTAASGDLQRQVEAEFLDKDAFFRFVVHDDVIAFQRG